MNFLICIDSVAEWKEGKRRGIWLNIGIKNSHLIPVAVAHDFVFHHAKPSYVIMTRWLVEGTESSIPEYCGNNIGVGGFVVCPETDEVLCIKERRGPYLGWKFPGGSVDNGEDLPTACKREVKEETGVDIEVKGVMLFRHMFPFRFDTGDTYYMCLCEPKTKETRLDEKEIAEVAWKPMAEVKAMESVSPMVKTVLAAYEQYKKQGSLITFERPTFAPEVKAVYTLFKLSSGGTRENEESEKQ